MDKPGALGIDIGGTKTLCLLVDKRCRSIHEVKFKTAPEEGREEFTQNLLHAVRTLKRAAENHGMKIVGVGLGCAGQVDVKQIRIKTSPNIVALEDYPIGKHLRKELPVPITIGNDVQLGVYAEHRIGVAAGCRNVLGVFFGTGVGGAAIINDELYTGASGLGGQVGSILAQPVGGPQAALSHGILDRIASKAAIASEALVMAVKDWAPYLHRKVDTDLSKVTWGMLKRAIRHGDNRIEEMLRARMHVVGIALSNIVNFLNPNILVLGGGLMTELPEFALFEIESGLRNYLVPEVSDVLKVRVARLEGRVVALGAAHQGLRLAKK